MVVCFGQGKRGERVLRRRKRGIAALPLVSGVSFVVVPVVVAVAGDTGASINDGGADAMDAAGGICETETVGVEPGVGSAFFSCPSSSCSSSLLILSLVAPPLAAAAGCFFLLAELVRVEPEVGGAFFAFSSSLSPNKTPAKMSKADIPFFESLS